MGTTHTRSELTTHVQHSGHQVQASTLGNASQELSQGFVLLPSRVISDRKNGSRLRVLAWLSSRGATTRTRVRVSQDTLARELQLARSTIQSTLFGLAKSGYIEILIDPISRDHSYRLLSVAEGGR